MGRTAIFVSVRDRSTRLPGKARADIGGKPAIVRLVERLRRSREADLLVMCTSVHPDDAVLAELARACGVACFRGSEEDKLERYRGAAREHSVDFAVIVDGDDILCDPDEIDRIVRAQRGDGADYVFVENLPLGATGFGLRVDALERVCAMKAESDTEVWDEYLSPANGFRTLRLPAPAALRRPELRLTLDYAVDLALFRAIFAELGPDTPFTLGDVVALLDRRPDLTALNAGVRETYQAHLQKSAPARVRAELDAAAFEGAPYTAPDRDARPILVFGSPRSGTTLLNAMLRHHPELALTYTHLHFWLDYYRRYDPLGPDDVARLVHDVGAMLARYGGRWSADDRAAVLRRLETAGRPTTYCGVYESLVRTLGGGAAARFGETYPGDGSQVPFFHEAYPQGPIVYIHRDPRDVFLSEKARLRRDSPVHFERRGYIVILAYWMAAARMAAAAEAALPRGQFARVAFAQLVREPEPALRAVCDVLRLPFATEMLDVERFRDDHGRPWESNSSFAPVRAIDRAPLGRWERGLAAEEIAFIETTAEREMRTLGYVLPDPEALRAKEERYSGEIRALRAEMARQLDVFESQVSRPFVPRAWQDGLRAGTRGDKPLLIQGDAEPAWGLGQAARAVRRTVRAYAIAGGQAGIWDGVPVASPEEAARLGADVQRVCAGRLPAPSGLARLTYRPPAPVRCAGANRIANASFEDTEPLVRWTVAGAGAKAGVVPSTLDSRGQAARLVYGQATASLLQSVPSPAPGEAVRVLVSAWVRATTAQVARLQVHDAGALTVSASHAGDGVWALVWLVHEIAPHVPSVDVYLQLIGEGEAEWDDVELRRIDGV